jgi:dienelactone hydrolase
LVHRGYVVAVPTYPLTARYGSWPGGYLRDIDDQGVDLAFILEELIDLPFVDADRIGLTGVSAGGFTSLLTAFHESGFDGTVQGVATEIARPLTAPNELNVPIGAADVPMFMSNNVDDRTTVFGPADAFWQAAATPKYRWLEDTPTEIPGQDHGFSTQDSFELLSLFLDAYVLDDPEARCALDAYPDPDASSSPTRLFRRRSRSRGRWPRRW